MMVSGAPLTATNVPRSFLPVLGSVALMVATELWRLRADENWKRRLTWTLPVVVPAAAAPALLERMSFFPRVQPRAVRVAFSMGSPTMSPSSSLTRAWAEARTRVVSMPAA